MQQKGENKLENVRLGWTMNMMIVTVERLLHLLIFYKVKHQNAKFVRFSFKIL